jgi:hypothetical protein
MAAKTIVGSPTPRPTPKAIESDLLSPSLLAPCVPAGNVEVDEVPIKVFVEPGLVKVSVDEDVVSDVRSVD